MVFEELKNCSGPFFYWDIRIEGGCMYIHGEEDIIWLEAIREFPMESVEKVLGVFQVGWDESEELV